MTGLRGDRSMGIVGVGGDRASIICWLFAGSLSTTAMVLRELRPIVRVKFTALSGPAVFSE